MITVVGSLNIDLTTIVNHYPKLGETLMGSKFETNFGGKGANQAVAAARLGGNVQMIGCVGADFFGSDYKNHLHEEGVLVDHVQVVKTSTGTASITVAGGDNAIIVVPGANFSLTPKKIEEMKETITNSTMILLQLEIPMETVEKVLEMAMENGVPTILNPAPFQSIPSHWWKMLTYITPNEHEAQLLMEEPNFKEEYKDKIIITIGKEGVLYYKDGVECHIAAPTVSVVDTTGAGDTFNGALAYFLHEGFTLEKACENAVTAASISVTKLGAQTGMPTIDQLEDVIRAK